MQLLSILMAFVFLEQTMDQCNGSIGELVITSNETKGCFIFFIHTYDHKILYVTYKNEGVHTKIETFKKLPFNLVHLTLKRVFLHLHSISPNLD